MPVIAAADAPVFDLGDTIITGLASPARGATDTAAWRVRLAADAASPRHSLDREEVFIVLDGALTAEFSDREETATAGDALIVPAGQEFALRAAAEQAEAICVLPVGCRAHADGRTFTPPWAE